MDIKGSIWLHENSACCMNPWIFGYGIVNCEKQYTSNSLSCYRYNFNGKKNMEKSQPFIFFFNKEIPIYQ